MKASSTARQFSASGTSGTVDWEADLEYQTSGAYPDPSYQLARTFQTTATRGHQETYSGQGGKVTVHASSVDGQAAPVSFVITGRRVPGKDITERLVKLYSDAGGATPRLMTGVAQKESSYFRFTRQTLYDTFALWPLESGQDGGSHVGLMMMPTSDSLGYAWNWQTNTSAGVSFFVGAKLTAATRKMNRFIKLHPGLRALNPVELEHMALVLYGPAASGDPGMQYYIPVKSGNGWTWEVNSDGNPAGVAYADSCFSLIHKE